MRIRSIDALEVIDSRGNPTVEARVHLEDGTVAEARVPSGASTGEREATELRDGGTRYGGKGVAAGRGQCQRRDPPVRSSGLDAADQDGARPAHDRARRHAEQVAARRQRHPRCLYGGRAGGRRRDPRAVPLYRHLGGGADDDTAILPVPCLNVINGGRHADNTVDFQEFKIAPHNAPTFAEALRMGIEAFHALRDAAQTARQVDRHRRRGRIRPRPRYQRGGGRADPGGHRGGELSSRDRHRPVPRPGHERDVARRRLRRVQVGPVDAARRRR